jgi:hypothetical protein
VSSSSSNRLRRDPSDTIENEFKEDHYSRIAYTNERFQSGKPGWKTDRVILYGKPTEIESHPAGGQYERPFEEGGGSTALILSKLGDIDILKVSATSHPGVCRPDHVR